MLKGFKWETSLKEVLSFISRSVTAIKQWQSRMEQWVKMVFQLQREIQSISVDLTSKHGESSINSFPSQRRARRLQGGDASPEETERKRETKERRGEESKQEKMSCNISTAWDCVQYDCGGMLIPKESIGLVRVAQLLCLKLFYVGMNNTVSQHYIWIILMYSMLVVLKWILSFSCLSLLQRVKQYGATNS